MSLRVMTAAVFVLACASTAGAAEPGAAVAPLELTNGVGNFDVCGAVPREDIEAVMGRKLAAPPKRFEYYDTAGTSGCWYEAAKGSDGEAFFGYIVFTPVEVYANQPLYLKADVSGLGRGAYFNNGADARQLWVKVSDKVAFVVAFGDQPREDGAKSIARLLLAGIK